MDFRVSQKTITLKRRTILKSIYELNALKYRDNFMWGKSKGISYAYIEITEKCNSQCIYCQIANPRSIDIDKYLYNSLIDQLSELNVFEIRLGGGEPLLCDEIVSMISYACSKNIAIWICTNGSLLNKKMANDLKNAGLTGVKVSLDSCIPKIHNALRGGSGSWEAAVNAIRNSKSIGLETMINYTIGVQNINEYEQMMSFGELLGCRVATHFIMPTGRGVEYHKKFDMNNRFAESQSRIINGLSGDLYCTAGSDMVAISVTGGVRACLFADEVADANKSSLKDIFESDSMKKYMTKIPESKICNKCEYNKVLDLDSTCPIISVCRGGCWYFYEKNNSN